MKCLVNDIDIRLKKDKINTSLSFDFPKSRVGNKLLDIYRMKKEIDSKNILHN